MKIDSVVNFTGEHVEAILVNDVLTVRSILDTELEEVKISSETVQELILELQTIYSSMKQTEKKVTPRKTIDRPQGCEPPKNGSIY